jgi:hypothetical protein
MGEQAAFIRVGTLDDPGACPPDIHIFTQSKQPWVIIPEGARQTETYYKWREVWPDWAKARREKMS